MSARGVAVPLSKLAGVALAGVVVLGGCSLDYEQISIAEEREESVPETVATDAEFTVVRGAGRTFRISASKAETYPEREEQILHDIEFEEIVDDGEIITEGAAERAVHDTATDDVTMSGDISFYSQEYEARVTTEQLSWDNEEKLLRGPEDGTVRLELDSGSVVEGSGFEADMRRSVARFADAVEGVLVTDDE